MELLYLLKNAVERHASDIFIIAGRPVAFGVNYDIENYDEATLTPSDTRELIEGIYDLSYGRSVELLEHNWSDDFSFTIQDISRFRVSAYIQRGSFAAVIRVISFEMPNPKLLGISDNIMNLADKKKGLVLVTGSAGSGKSTTLACIIDKINREQKKHIITLEDPLEYLHSHKQSIVSQREIGSDASDYLSALKSALRQRPDVILLGEMRDIETISITLTAAETGHMIFSTLHTVGAANTIDRILDVFDSTQRQQIAVQLSMILEAVVSQQLIPTLDGKVVLATEVMTMTPAVRNLIRDNKVHQLDNVILSSQDQNMVSMDASIFSLFQEGLISQETAINFSANPEMMKKKIV